MTAREFFDSATGYSDVNGRDRPEADIRLLSEWDAASPMTESVNFHGCDTGGRSRQLSRSGSHRQSRPLDVVKSFSEFFGHVFVINRDVIFQ